MTPYAPTSLALEELLQGAFIKHIGHWIGVLGAAKVVEQQEDAEIQDASQVSVTTSTPGEISPNTGVHRMNVRVQLRVAAAEKSEEVYKKIWGAVMGALWSATLKTELMTAEPRLLVYGIVRAQPSNPSVSGDVWMNSISLEVPCVEKEPTP